MLPTFSAPAGKILLSAVQLSKVYVALKVTLIWR